MNFQNKNASNGGRLNISDQFSSLKQLLIMGKMFLIIYLNSLEIKLENEELRSQNSEDKHPESQPTFETFL